MSAESPSDPRRSTRASSGIIFSALLAMWLVASTLPVSAADQGGPAKALNGLEAAAESAAAPVEIDGHELFRVRGVSSIPAYQRAAAIRDRIVAPAGDPSFTVESLRAEESGGYVSIMAGRHKVQQLLRPATLPLAAGNREAAGGVGDYAAGRDGT